MPEAGLETRMAIVGRLFDRIGWLLGGAVLVGAGWRVGGAFGPEVGVAAGLMLAAFARTLGRRRAHSRQVAWSGPEIGETEYQAGYRLLCDGRSEQAIPYLERAVLADANDLDARFYLGLAF